MDQRYVKQVSRVIQAWRGFVRNVFCFKAVEPTFEKGKNYFMRRFMAGYLLGVVILIILQLFW